eukprot:COSAG05_NODE_778_length_7403_cov_636.272180_1_plen_146_part_00
MSAGQPHRVPPALPCTFGAGGRYLRTHVSYRTYMETRGGCTPKLSPAEYTARPVTLTRQVAFENAHARQPPLQARQQAPRLAAPTRTPPSMVVSSATIWQSGGKLAVVESSSSNDIMAAAAGRGWLAGGGGWLAGWRRRPRALHA